MWEDIDITMQKAAELTPLTKALGFVCNIDHELKQGSTPNRISDYLNQAWQQLRTAYKEYAFWGRQQQRREN
ncbi:hypothetical protein KP17_18875 [Pectobacterium parvum]|nr:hypothetical protein KP17_18875 [Pectobacterium parvum]